MSITEGIGSYLDTVDWSNPQFPRGRTDWLFGSCITFIAPTLLVLGFRLFWRAYKRTFGCDDALILVSGLGFVALTVVGLLASHYGVGQHVKALAAQHPESIAKDLSRIIRLLLGCYASYTASITFTKLSILGSYMRIFPMHCKLVYSIGAICIAMAISSTATVFLMCSPVKSIWDPNIPRERCINIQGFFLAIGIINAVTDLAIWGIGIYVIWHVQTNKKQKFGLILLYALGFFAFTVSIVRVCRLGGLQDPDISFTCVMPVSWSVIEASVGIICASLPSLRQLWGIFKTWLSGTGQITDRTSSTAGDPPVPDSVSGHIPEPRPENNLAKVERAIEMVEMEEFDYHSFSRNVYRHDTSCTSSLGPDKDLSQSFAELV